MASRFLLALLLLCPTIAQAWTLEGDRIEQPLTTHAGDATRGEAIVGSRTTGLCMLCHALPGGNERQQGNIGPDLTAVGKRLNEAQLRARMVASREINPASKMPGYFKSEGLINVSPTLHGVPILNAQQIEDVVAYLVTQTAR